MTTRKTSKRKIDKQIKGTQRKDDTQNGTYGIVLDLISKSKSAPLKQVVVVQKV